MAIELNKNTIKNWNGDTAEAQHDLFRHMLMFILAKEQGFDKLLSESEWVTLSRPVVEEYADFYATDMLDDVLIAYDVPDLVQFRTWHIHVGDDDILREIDPLYVDFICGVSSDRYKQLCAWMANEIDKVDTKKYIYIYLRNNCCLDYLKNVVSFVWYNIFLHERLHRLCTITRGYQFFVFLH